MAVDLGSIIRTLEAIEARHPDTRADLTPIVAALTAPDGVLLAQALRVRARQAALGALDGDELTAEELALLSATRPGSLPWRRPAGA